MGAQRPFFVRSGVPNVYEKERTLQDEISGKVAEDPGPRRSNIVVSERAIEFESATLLEHDGVQKPQKRRHALRLASGPAFWIGGSGRS